MGDLIHFGLMPEDPVMRKKLEGIDPYYVRRKALDKPLRPYELGRALFHLNQRRGFKSNRKAGDAKEDGDIRDGVSLLDKAMQSDGSRTLGEHLHRRRRHGESARAKPGAGFYASRRHYANEFEKIREAQVPHQTLGDADWARLEDTIFFQRELKPVDPGRCSKLPDELRAARALPLSQRLRIIQEVESLEVLTPGSPDRPLTASERETAVNLLLGSKDVRFDRLRRALSLGSAQTFNMESERRKGLKGDETAACLAAKKIFGANWRALDMERQTEIVKALLDPKKDDDDIIRMANEWGLDKDAAEAVVRVGLPSGYSRLSEKAMQSVMDGMAAGLRYHEAVAAAFPNGGSASPESRELLPRLPHYPEVGSVERYLAGGAGGDSAGDVFERLGRIGNPTVHIALGQVRRLVNAVIDEYGRPKAIVVELGRDLKNSMEKRREIEKAQGAGAS